MNHHATGTFEVKLAPQKPDNPQAEAARTGRLSIDKTFAGDLEGVSTGEMLSYGTEVKGSAGYVAIERVAGKLGSRGGTFALQHSGLMSRGTPSLSVVVVPDSGTGELTGLSGTFTIRIEQGKHFYDFEYCIAAATPAAPVD